MYVNVNKEVGIDGLLAGFPQHWL